MIIKIPVSSREWIFEPPNSTHNHQQINNGPQENSIFMADEEFLHSADVVDLFTLRCDGS